VQRLLRSRISKQTHLLPGCLGPSRGGDSDGGGGGGSSGGGGGWDVLPGGRIAPTDDTSSGRAGEGEDETSLHVDGLEQHTVLVVGAKV
jgi:hypothetical protein